MAPLLLGLLPSARTVARRLRAGWELLLPTPGPRYLSDTPRVSGTQPFDVFFPPNVPTLAAAAQSPETARFVISVLEKLTPSDEHDVSAFYHRWGQAKFGDAWRYADITTVLRAAALFLRPHSYLEIGVRRGRSSAIVAATCPQCAIYGFDLWLPGYANDANPGPDFVRGELRAVGYRGDVTLISGDSKRTVPAFLRDHPELFLDLITVDGDHSVAGAAADLVNVLPRLKVGGIVVFDDICAAPLLTHVWRSLVEKDSRYVTWEFTDAGYGIAAAIRVRD